MRTTTDIKKIAAISETNTAVAQRSSKTYNDKTAVVAVILLCAAVTRGINYLARTQGADGFWNEERYTATGFPRVFYLRYHGYRVFFPLWALARYRRLSLANSRRVAFGLSLLSAGTPMFFMGEEVGAQKPYRFNDFLANREDIKGDRAGENFIAVTDPNTKLAAEAAKIANLKPE